MKAGGKTETLPGIVRAMLHFSDHLGQIKPDDMIEEWRGHDANRLEQSVRLVLAWRRNRPFTAPNGNKVTVCDGYPDPGLSWGAWTASFEEILYAARHLMDHHGEAQPAPKIRPSASTQMSLF